MPGGRNSGAVYNMYKVKYKKHKKATAVNGPGSANGSSSGSLTPATTRLTHHHPSVSSVDGNGNPSPPGSAASSSGKASAVVDSSSPFSSSSSGGWRHPADGGSNGGNGSADPVAASGINILRAALTGSGEIPRQYRSLASQNKPTSSSPFPPSPSHGPASSSSRPASADPSITRVPVPSEEPYVVLINELIDCDDFEDIATLKVRLVTLFCSFNAVHYILSCLFRTLASC